MFNFPDNFLLQNTYSGFLERFKLFEKEVVIYSEPSTNSAVVTHMKKDTIYDVIPFGNHDQNWARIRDAYGNEGYIDGKARSIKL